MPSRPRTSGALEAAPGARPRAALGGLAISITTGIAELDAHFGALGSRAVSLLFLSDAPSEKRTLVERIIAGGLEAGEACLYVDFFRLPALVRADFSRLGRFSPDQLVLVDALSKEMLIPTAEPYVIQDFQSLESVLAPIEAAILQGGVRHVVIDSLEYLADRFDKARALEFCAQLLDLCRQEGASLILLLTNWTFHLEELRRLKRLLDGFVEFRSNLTGGVSLNQLRLSVGGQDAGDIADWIPFSFTDPMGFVARAPRLIVVGAEGVGKSDLVRLMDPDSVLIEPLNAPEGAPAERLQVRIIESEVFGDPDDPDFGAMVRLFAREADGAILVVGGDDPDGLERSRPLLALAERGIPLVVALTVPEPARAEYLEALQSRGGLGTSAPVLCVDEDSPEEAWRVLDSLLTQVAKADYRWHREPAEGGA